MGHTEYVLGHIKQPQTLEEAEEAFTNVFENVVQDQSSQMVTEMVKRGKYNKKLSLIWCHAL